jgi:1-deoxy-D-xylulose-5-phosphate reductoisomerase
VQFADGAVKAQMGVPDMRLPIQYALSFPRRLQSSFDRLDFCAASPLTFEHPDMDRFRCLAIAYEALSRGGNMPCVLNAANEVANLAFRQSRISFLRIAEVIERTLAAASFKSNPSYDDYVASDSEARALANTFLN